MLAFACQSQCLIPSILLVGHGRFFFCSFDLWSISSTLIILLTRSDFWLIPSVCLSICLSVYLYVSVCLCLSAIHCGQDPTCTTWGFIDGITGAEAPKGASDGSSGGEPSLTFSESQGLRCFEKWKKAWNHNMLPMTTHPATWYSLSSR